MFCIFFCLFAETTNDSGELEDLLKETLEKQEEKQKKKKEQTEAEERIVISMQNTNHTPTPIQSTSHQEPVMIKIANTPEPTPSISHKTPEEP